MIITNPRAQISNIRIKTIDSSWKLALNAEKTMFENLWSIRYVRSH